MRRLKQALLMPWAGGAGASSLLAGLVAYWKMDEVSGDRSDSVGGFTLTDVNTVTSAAGKQALAAEFTAANSENLNVVSAAALQGGLRDFTFDGWFYPTILSGTQFVLTKGTGSGGNGHEYGLFFGPTTASWRVSAGAASQTLAITAGLLVDTWHYFALWYDSATGIVWGQFNNNAAVFTAALAGTPNTTASPLFFGVWSGLSGYYTGRIDEVGRWNRILTGAERLARYNGGAGNTYPF